VLYGSGLSVPPVGLTVDSCDLTVAPGGEVEVYYPPRGFSPTVTLAGLTAAARIVNQGTMTNDAWTVQSSGSAGTSFLNSGTVTLGSAVLQSSVPLTNLAGGTLIGGGSYTGDI